jgi:hypothetical protein
VRRFEREAANDVAIAAVYDRLKAGEISANATALPNLARKPPDLSVGMNRMNLDSIDDFRYHEPVSQEIAH